MLQWIVNSGAWNRESLLPFLVLVLSQGRLSNDSNARSFLRNEPSTDIYERFQM